MSNPSSVQINDGYKWQVLGIVMIGTLMSALDSSIVNVSIPSIMADFGSSLDDIEWVVTSYMLAFATLMPLTAWLRDRVGHKALYIGSLAVFTVGSALCGLAWNLPTLILARVIQAAGGGAITPTGMAMITETFEPHERGRALGFWAMGAVMGPAFGPTIGGYLTRGFGWPSIFLVNIPFGILGVIFAFKLLRADRPVQTQHRQFDAAGFIFLSTFLISFLLGMSKGQQEGWTSTYEITCVVIAILGLIGFLLVQSIQEAGIMDLNLLGIPVFAACFLLTSIRSVALYGGSFLLPIFLQSFRGFDEVQSGLMLLPGSLLMGVLMPFTGRLGDKISPRLMAFVGFTLLGTFFYEYKYLDSTTSNWGIIWPTLIRGLGLSLLIAPLTATAMNAVPKEKAGMAASMLNIMQQVGGSVGIALLSVVLTRRSAYHLSIIGGDVATSSPAYREAIHGLYLHAKGLGMNHFDALRAAGRVVAHYVGSVASVMGFQDAFLVGSLITFLTLFVVFLLPARPIAHARGGEPVHLE